MWGWILNLFRRDDRLLFHYWDGVRNRSIDPIVAHRALWNDTECLFVEDGPISCNPKDANGNPSYPITYVLEAEDRVRALGRKVFGVKPYSDQQPGLTCLEVDALLGRFVAFSADLKKKLSPSATSSPPMESTVPFESPDIEDCQAGQS